MMEINGAFANAIVYTDEIESSAIGQIQALCDQSFAAGSKIRIMPDVHTGKGCTIGTTMTVGEYVVPNLVGVDIGCGMDVVLLKERRINLPTLDSFISRNIPHGRDVREKPHRNSERIDLSELECFGSIDTRRALESIGTLGGGNHFIEVDRNDAGELYLVVHSGSRHLGLEVCNYYQDQGRFAMWGGARYQLDQKIAEYKATGRHREIQSMLKEMKKEHKISVPKELTWVEGQLFNDYIHDMRIIQRFAVLNRKAMTDVILTGLSLTRVEEFTTIHNYIDTESMILRTGSVSAKAGEKLLIPINMRDGSLICVGKGNEDWNCSAPHGAGRLMSRKQAAATLSMDEYRSEMEGIYTTCVVEDTIDESPMAYKSLDEIVSQIGPTAEIVERIRPVYNFKAAE